MKLVRIDRIAPGGEALDLHPRMTVVADAPPELRRRLVEVFRSFSQDTAPGHPGLLEVSGVRLTLDRATLDQLQLDPLVDAVLRFGGPDASDRPVGDSLGQVPGETTTDALRRRLREVAARRTQLAERMEHHRNDLDPHAGTAVEVGLGQIEALESRRSTLRAEWERERSQRDEHRDELRARRASLRTWLEQAGRLDAAAVQAARDALVRVIEPPTELDPVAVRLADRLEGLLVEARELAARRTMLQLREREATQRLDEAVEAARSAERAMRSGSVDPDVVARLEQVRDEIFSVGDRAGRLSSSRNKRRVSELRAEEAVLLDRLGYDTNSAYVMGIPSLRAEMERISRVDTAQNRSERIEAEVEQLRAELPDRRTVDRAGVELSAALVESLEYLGDPRALSLASSERDPDDVEQLAELVYSTTEELRLRRVTVSTDDAPQVMIATDRLRRVLEDNCAEWPDDDEDPVGPFPEWSTAVSASELVDVARDWAFWHERVERAIAPARARLAAIEDELAALDAAGDPVQDVSRWAEVEAELDAALDRLNAAEERVRVHELATAAIAELREQELHVRDEERSLLAAIAEAERPTGAMPLSPDLPPSGLPSSGSTATPPPYHPPPYHPPAGADGWGSTEPGTGDAAVTPPADAPAARPSTASVEWTVVSRLAEQRSVSFAGSIPVLVDGLPEDPADAAAVVRRLQAMSDLVQVVLLAGGSDPSLGLVDRSTASLTSF